MTNLTSRLSLIQLFRNWRGLPHQIESIELLEKDLLENGAEVALQRSRPWYTCWSNPDAPSANDLCKGIALIKEFESLELTAYPDPGTGGEPWTIGYGNTRYANGGRVKKGDKITKQQAEDLLQHEVNSVVKTLEKTIPFWSEMDSGKRSALLSFAFNLGQHFYGGNGFNTITKRLKEKDWEKVPEALLLYRNPGSNVEAGLLRRRKAEGKLWSEG
jgi:GH24 family phage-related lysozyme (muramidase)